MTHNPDPLEDLLRSARRVEAAVRLEWHNTVQKRSGRRRAGLIAVTCLTTAAVIALVLHAHVPPQVVVAPMPAPRPVHAPYDNATRGSGSYFRVNNDDRRADRGVPRRVLAGYTTETR